MCKSNAVFARALYRSILKGAKTVEDSPAVKNDADALPDMFRRMLKVYLGLKDFYMPDPKRYYSLPDRVRQGARLLGSNTTVEENLRLLRFMNSALESGRKHQLLWQGACEVWQRGNVELVDRPCSGALLIAHPMLTGWFKRSVILLLSHTKQSSLGLCINKPLTVTLRELQLRARSALSNVKKGQKTVTIHVENYGDLRFSSEMAALEGCLFVPSQRHESLEATASYRQALKDAQEEARVLYEALVKKKLSGAGLEADEYKSMLDAEKLLQLPLSVSEKEIKYGKGQASEGPAPSTSSSDITDDVTAAHSSASDPREDLLTGSEARRFGDSKIADRLICNGGPVQSIGALHNVSTLPGSAPLPGITFSESSNLQLWKHQIDHPLSGDESIQFFLGECTWSEGQLVDELSQGCWILCQATDKELELLSGKTEKFSHSREGLWAQLLHALGGEYAEFARIPYELPDVL